MNTIILHKTLRYLAQALAIYLIFRYLPNLAGASLSNTDVLIITVIIMLIYILFENLCSLYTDTSSNQSASCNSTCSLKEGMATISPIPLSSSPQIVDVSAPVNNGADQLDNNDSLDVNYGVESKPAVITSRSPNDNINLDNIDSLIKTRIEQALERKYLKQYEEEKINLDNLPQIERAGSRPDNGIITDDLGYDTDYNHLPMATGQDKDFIYGYSMIPPVDWYPKGYRPPLCVQQGKECPPCPVNTEGLYSDLLDWDNTLRITQPDDINTKYIKKLNAGR
jgi:hypothetical protein